MDKCSRHARTTPPNAIAGRFADAVAEQERAIEMLRAAGNHDKISDYQTRLDLYQNRQPYRD